MDYQAIVSVLALLLETYVAMLEMKMMIGYTDREIAQRLGITESAVSILARGNINI